MRFVLLGGWLGRWGNPILIFDQLVSGVGTAWRTRGWGRACCHLTRALFLRGALENIGLCRLLLFTGRAATALQLHRVSEGPRVVVQLLRGHGALELVHNVADAPAHLSGPALRFLGGEVRLLRVDGLRERGGAQTLRHLAHIQQERHVVLDDLLRRTIDVVLLYQ